MIQHVTDKLITNRIHVKHLHEEFCLVGSNVRLHLVAAQETALFMSTDVRI
jgi:hypothetical protein